MSTVTFLYKPRPTSIGAVVVDATVRTKTKADAEVTEHPVEQGANISDHIRVKNEEVTIEGVIANFPMGVQSGAALTAQAARDFVDQQGHGATLKAIEENRAVDALRTLTELKNKAQPVQLTAGVRTWPTMAIKSFEVERSRTTGNALTFTMQLVEIRLVSTQQTTPPTTRAAAPKKTKGNKATTNANEPEQKKSVLYQGLETATPKSLDKIQVDGASARKFLQSKGF